MAQTEGTTEPSNELGARLRALRQAAKLTGVQLADGLDWVQSKVSRIETGRQLPTEDDIRKWTDATNSTGEQAALLDLLAGARAVQVSWRQQLRAKDLSGIQVSYEQLGHEAAVIRNVEVAVVPGRLQTAEYARFRLAETASWFGLSEDQVTAAVAARMRRQDILYSPSKRFEFVITEAVLRTLVCPAEVMLGQLDRLLTVIGLPTVTLGILPMGERLPAVPLHGFVMFDDLVIVETYDQEIVLRADDARIYERIATDLLAAARTGDDARRLIVAAADSLRVTLR